jgi:hypothetical protein
MSGYGKRDEDADGAVVRVDRTAVFQEGEHCLGTCAGQLLI